MIKVNDLKEMNSFLKYLNIKNSPFELYVDNLHTPYILLSKNYILPPISNMNLTKQDIFTLIKILSEFIPEAITGCSILPIQKPKREIGKISFIKEFSFGGYKYLYVFKVDASYLGGSQKEKMKSSATQLTHPAIETDRIYFTARIIPIKNVILDDGEIIDFEVKTFDKGIFYSDVDEDIRNKPQNFSELFDEIDYSQIIEPIKISLKIVHPNWVLGKIFEPVYIEYLTLAIRFLSGSYTEIYNYFSHFHELLEVIHSGKTISEITLRNFIFWMHSHNFERSTSPSGNIRWKIITN